MTKGRATKNEIEAIVNRPYTIEVIYGEAPDDGVLARVAEWPGCLTAGDTREEALSRIGDAMRDWVKARLERGLPIAEPMTEYGGEVGVEMPHTPPPDGNDPAGRRGGRLNQWSSTTRPRAAGSS